MYEALLCFYLTDITYAIPGFSFKDVNGSWYVGPSIISETRNIEAKPFGYKYKFLLIVFFVFKKNMVNLYSLF